MPLVDQLAGVRATVAEHGIAAVPSSSKPGRRSTGCGWSHPNEPDFANVLPRPWPVDHAARAMNADDAESSGRSEVGGDDRTRASISRCRAGRDLFGR
jgi:hypothetical protein